MILHPFFNWVGSKKAYVTELERFCPKQFDPLTSTYFEPFLGTGSLFLFLQPTKAYVSDADATVALAFQCMKGNSQQVKDILMKIYEEPDLSKTYAALCENFNALSSVQKTAALIFISKHSYGSIFRFTTDGTRLIRNWRGHRRGMNWLNFERVARYLKSPSIKVAHASFESVLSRAKKGDFIFLDPPYINVRKQYSRYYKHNDVSLDDLAYVMNKLDEKGCFVLLINCVEPALTGKIPQFKRKGFRAWEKFVGAKEARKESIFTNYLL